MLKALYVLAAAVTVATLVPVSIALAGLRPEMIEFGFYNNADSRIDDAKGDVEPVYQQSGAGLAPGARDYYDIVSASVKKQDEAFLFSIELAGNPDENENYETLYLWNIITDVNDKEQHYRILLPHFAIGDNSTERGWYFAVFNVTSNTYIVPMTKINDMPENKVEFAVKDFFIGAPSSFRYWVDVYVRTSNTLVGPPDYLMDYAP